ncbi:MAG: YkgJ family cysteine cluster protein [bacterium]|nr:YkgJ family cysteine cluster protein [bacterium]
MKVETDLEKIKKYSVEKEADNWGFRSFLKSCEISSKKIDTIVQHLNKQVTAKIDCQSCANCCKTLRPEVTDKDAGVIAKKLGIPAEEFKAKYLAESEMGSENCFNQAPCPFLADNACTIYEFRPADCSSYPHLQKKKFSSRIISVIQNYEVCPIVFNVYEGLKDEIRSLDDSDDPGDSEDFY